MLRIISGERRGRLIKTVSGSSTRPTTDRVKESLFNILQPRLPGSSVLDLYSGTGNLGLEALSRGCEDAVFVEKDPKALAVLRENCRSMDYPDYIDIMPLDVRKAIPVLSAKGRTFDIVIMDPPYNHDLESPTIEALDTYGLVKEDGIIVVEHLLVDEQQDSIGSFARYDIRKYGNTAISLYRKEARTE
jgi:16S rRNA (guanine(966)-N(2))-methyltransferase RsmD